MKIKKETRKTQKISFKVSEVLLKLFNDEISELPISRDLFLQNLIKIECEYLADDLHGMRLTDDARAVIAKELRFIKQGTKQVSLVIDIDVAARLNEIVEEHNIVRDSFLNRILYFLLLTEPLRKRLQLAKEFDLFSAHAIEEEKYGVVFETIPTSPLKWLAQVLANPFRYLREELSRTLEGGEKLYLIPMPKKLLGFTCYVEGSLLPGTVSYRQIEKELIKATKLF